MNIENENYLKNTHNMEFICIDVLEWQCNIFEVNVSNDTHLSNFRSTDIKITDLRKQFSKVQEQTNEEREKKMACFKISFSYIYMRKVQVYDRYLEKIKSNRLLK